MRTVSFLLLALIQAAGYGAVIHVPAEQPTIQAGIDAAQDGDLVLVADGIYAGPGNRALDFNGKAITVRSENGPGNCVIDGGGVERGFYFHSGEGPGAVVEGFTIRDGREQSGGGGIGCFDGSSPTISGNVVVKCRGFPGGGICSIASSPLITGNVIMRNQAFGASLLAGGGIYCEGGSPVIENNVIARNAFYSEYGGVGAGICTNQCRASIRGNTIELNVAGTASSGGLGGGIYCFAGMSEMADNVIRGNLNATIGGGIYIDDGDARITGNIIEGHQTSDGGAGIRIEDGTVLIAGNGIIDNATEFYGGGVQCTAGDVEFTGNTISGNIADVGGGCSFGSGTTITLAGDRIDGNEAGSGSALFLYYCAVSGHDCSITGNRTGLSATVYCSNSDLRMQNLIMTGNTGGRTGGIFASDSAVELENATISRNHSPNPGGALLSFISSISITNSVLWGNERGEVLVISGDAPQITWSVVQGGYSGEGNLDIDPLLLPAPGGALCLSQTAAGQALDSPCVDGANPASSPPGGSTRTDSLPDTGILDMGYHYPAVLRAHLCRDPKSLEFSAVPSGAPPPPATIGIWAGGPRSIDWAVAESAGWLTLTPLSGSSSGEIDEVDVAVDPAGLAPGTYTGEIVVSADGAAESPQTVYVQLHVSTGVVRVPEDQPTIQAGIDAALPGDLVLVGDGTYAGEGNRDLDFGGKRVRVQSVNGPDSCIIDCEEEGRGFLFDSLEGPESVVSGFRIRRGKAPFIPSRGGGIFCMNASPTISNCIISECVSDILGGGVGCLAASPLISGNLIENNIARCWWSAGLGAGIHIEYGAPIITGNVIRGNVGEDGDYTSRGGGIYCNVAPAQIIGNLIVENTSDSCGGLCNRYSDSVILNNTIADNASWSQGGVSVLEGSPWIVNCIIRGHWQNDLYVGSGTPRVRYCNIEDGYPWGVGIIDADPLFADGPQGGYYLSQVAAGQTSDSPCLDAGNMAAAELCFDGAHGNVCFDDLTTRTDEADDEGLVDMGFHYPKPATVSVDLECLPDSGTVPFMSTISVRVENLCRSRERSIAARLDLTLADGTQFSGWRQGALWLAPTSGRIYRWPQLIPRSPKVVGENTIFLLGEDVTPPPFNLPPYPASGDTDRAVQTVIGEAPDQ